MKKILSSVTKIRFQDCDPFNHLNNSKYLDYFLNAREDQVLENYNLDIFDLARTEAKCWVVASNQILYLQPVSTMETVLIDSQVINVSPKSIKVEMRMWDEFQSKLKSVLWSNFIFFDLTLQRPAKHSEKFMLLFNEVLMPVEQATFEDRSNYFLSNK